MNAKHPRGYSTDLGESTDRGDDRRMDYTLSTTLAMPYDDAVAISMMLVARRYERQGYGREVMRHALRGARRVA